MYLAVRACCLTLSTGKASAQATPDAAACSALTSLKIPGLDLVITRADWIPAQPAPPRPGPGLRLTRSTLQAYCRLDGVLGTDPSVVATGRAFPGRSRPLCAYPQHRHYKGRGDSEKAENFA